MEPKKQFFAIREDVLPEVFLKVMEVKKLLEVQKNITVQEATEKIGISRSSFYKYKDAIMPFYEKQNNRAITILIHLQDQSGALSYVLNHIASMDANVLTINQMIPINGTAIINMCIEISKINMDIQAFMQRIEELEGVQEAKLLATE